MFVAFDAKLDSNFRNVTFVSLSTKQRIWSVLYFIWAGDDCNAMNNITQKLPSPPRRTGIWDHIIELRDAWIASKIQKNFAFKHFSN